MAEFRWIQGYDSGCAICNVSVDERGFVDAIGDTLVRGVYGEVNGVVDIVICSKCTEQMARLIGSLTEYDSIQLVQKTIDLEDELNKTKDEVKAWSQRFQNLVDAISGGTDVNSIDATAGRAMSTAGMDAV